ncbi:MAG: exo-alpha-sialidase [Anaerolineae bacterium]|nr:exo-alpha-sialidase [Anaerolineae bacterium]
MRIPSPEETSSWFPDLAVDREGRVHVVWCETDHLAMNYSQPGDDIDPSKFERLYYSMWDGQQWSQANDIVPSQQNIIRNAIAVDDYNVLHLLFDFSPPFGLYYKKAQASQASSAAAWTPPRLVNSRSGTYMSDIAIFQDTLHIVYDDRGAAEGECPGCADIFYRRSTDRGLTWSTSVALFPTGTGSNYAQMEIDKTGVVYLAWNEGWDRLGGRGSPRYGVYMYSADGGSTWSAPTIVSYPNATNMRFAVGSDGQGGVMLVWRTASPEYPGIYYMWSTDYGESWSPPQALPDIFAQPTTSGHGMYDMATDSAGHIHLLVTGRLSIAQDPPGVYHLEWDGNNWSSPLVVYKGDWYPMYPHLVIDRGNQLHVTWSISESQETDEPLQAWYAHGQSQAPAETPVPLPTPIPSPMATPLATSTPTATPYPTLAPGGAALPDGLYTENDDLLRLLIGLAPVLILATAILAIRFGWLRRSSGR